MTARARRLATAKGPARDLPPEPFAAAVDRLLRAALSARGLPEAVATRVRDFAEWPGAWQDGWYFDCFLCRCRLPLVHTSLEDHCRGSGHQRLALLGPARAGKADSPGVCTDRLR
mmetsp:Transcript_97482/g.303636  ORF Transcript_97482/g.303636 Transcript_97482/m.303636 type:complete len:115 (-) Transcript_97482:56-400(-)